MKNTKEITSYNTQSRLFPSIESRPWPKAKSVLLCVLFAALLSCSSANFRSIERSTTLPGGGIAVHLDAAQRVLVASEGVYCAEPSPDAIKALAATIGLELKGLSDTDAAKLTGSLQEMIAHTGVRTQSTTLMRDALYRICEAYHNDQLEEASVLHLLARSQDLTAVVLAIEQLTANLLAVSGDRREDGEKYRPGSVEEGNVQPGPGQNGEISESVVNGKAVSPEQGAGSREAATPRRNSGGKEPRAEQEKGKQSEAAPDLSAGLGDEEEKNSESAQKEVTDSDDEPHRSTDSGERHASKAEADQGAATIGSRERAAKIPSGTEPSGRAIEAVAHTVRDLVALVLEKDYLVEACVALLLRDETNEEIKGTCLDLLSERAASEVIRDGAFRTVYDPNSDSEELVDRIREDPDRRESLAEWLGAEIRIDISVTELIYGSAYADLRREALEFLDRREGDE